MLGFLYGALSLVLALSVPFAGSFAKRYLNAAEESHFFSPAEEKLFRRGKRWKPHNSLKSAWPAVYACIGVASWLIWREGGFRSQATALGRYACMLLANLLCWPPTFFGGHSRRLACLDSAVLLLATLVTIPKFYEVNAKAGLLLLPYLGWTCFTSTLINCSLRSSNPAVLSRAQRMSALNHHGIGVASTAHAAHATAPVVPSEKATTQPAGPSRPREAAGHRPVLSVGTQQPSTSDAATSPFSDAGPSPAKASPLAQARDLLEKMTSTLEESTNAPANELLRAGLMRVNSLLNKVGNTFQGATPLSRVGSLLTRVSMTLQRGQSLDEETLRWPCSDSIPLSYFTCPGAAGYKVRGPTYLSDKKKIGPTDCVGKLVSLNLVSLKEPTTHISRFLPSIRDSRAPFIFVWQVMVPGRTHLSLTVAWALDHDPEAAISAAANRIPEDETVANHARDPSALVGLPSGQSTPPQRSSAGLDTPDTVRKPHGGLPEPFAVEHSSKSTSALLTDNRRRHQRTASTYTAEASPRSPQEVPEQAGEPLPAPKGAAPFDIAMARFLDDHGTEAEVTARRHGMFKIIPRIEKGGWVVKQAVGQNTPVLLGKKLTTKYFRGPRYLEVDVDVGSSRSAASVVGLVQGALKTLVIDIAILLEGKTQEELPESLLGTVRLEHLDLSKAALLDVAAGTIDRKD